MLKKYFSKDFQAIVLSVLFVTCASVFGDGVAFKGIDYRSLMPVVENEQKAVIVHNNGIEKMLLAVSLELESDEKAVWIFPVPGNPENIKIDVVDSFPKFTGKNPQRQVENMFEQMSQFAAATQIYTIPFTMGTLGVRHSTVTSLAGFEESVKVYLEVEKWGVHTELINADSIEALEKYLSGKAAKIDTNQLKVFQDYLSEKYALVLVWISSKQELLKEFPEYKSQGGWGEKKRWPCVFVEFPSEKIFYPMRPSSIYAENAIPISLFIKGLVKADSNSNYSRNSYGEYFTQKGLPEDTPSVLKDELTNDRMFYTLLNMHLTGSELTEDLWLTPFESEKIIFADNIAALGENKIIFLAFTVVYIFILSYLAAGFAGLVLFGRWNGYAQIGLLNVFTLIGFYVGTKINKGTAGNRLNEIDRFPGRWLFIIVFSIFYLILLGYLAFVINIL